MIPVKIKDVKPGELIFLHNYKKPSFIHAYKATEYTVENGKHLICRWKNCAQRLLDPDTTVYFP